MNAQQLSQFEQQLLELQEELLGVTEITQAASATVELDQTRMGRLSRMGAIQQQAMSQAMDARRGQQLVRVKKALERLDDDEYGECLECLVDISVARLKIDPTTEYCVDCASKREGVF